MPGFLQNGLQLIDDTLQLLFQADCAACGRSGAELKGGVCRFCRIWFPLRGPLCERCGWPISQPLAACGECARRKRPHLKAIRSLLWLEDSAKALVHRIKYSGRFEYVGLFEEAIRAHFQKFFEGEPVVIPVPLHPTRLARRGFNQAELVARTLTRFTRLPLAVDSLRKTRLTPPQAALSAARRVHNLQGSFVWRSGAVPSRILLVDDIYTTGATLQTAARALRRAGAKEVYAWTLFRTPLV